MIELSKEHPYEDACKILGIRPVANYKSYKLSDETRNFIKLETIAKALNEGWKPKVTNISEVKYSIWGWIDPRTIGGTLYIYRVTGSSGNRFLSNVSLIFKNREIAQEFVRLCKPIIVEYLFGLDDYKRFDCYIMLN